MAVALGPGLSFELLEARGQARPSQWARLWPSAVAMSRWLLERPLLELPASARELGCGLGLLGMTLAHLGLAVEGTDREPLALAFAARNAARNGLSGYSVRHLEWSEPSGPPGPLLVASDVLYEQGSPARLFELLLGSGLLLPAGQLLLGGPRARPEPLEELVGRLHGEGYTHREVRREVEWEGRREEIGIHLLRSPG